MLLKLVDIKALSNKKYNASITVEAAFSFTLTIFILFMMLGPLLIIKSTSDILLDMNNASKIRSNYEMIKYKTSNTSIYRKVESYINDNEFLNKNFENIENIVSNVSLFTNFNNKYGDNKREYRNIKSVYGINENVYDAETGIVSLDFNIAFDVPYNVLHIKNLKKRLLINRRAFIGADGDRFDKIGGSGEYAYLADNYVSSGVYHTYIDCTYLIKEVYSYSYNEVGKIKNANNEKYSKCNYCFRDIVVDNSTICFVTKYGDRYHYRENCPLMTAYVTKIPIEDVEKYGLRLCSRCEKKEEGNK